MSTLCLLAEISPWHIVILVKAHMLANVNILINLIKSCMLFSTSRKFVVARFLQSAKVKILSGGTRLSAYLEFSFQSFP